MARVGLSKAYYAKYAVSDGTISYSSGASMGKAVEAEIELEDSDNDVFYADNGPAESSNTFNGGTLTITNDRLPVATLADILGLTASDIMDSVQTTTKIGEHVTLNADVTPPYLGYGTIRKDIVGGSAKYTAMILYKIQFKVPSFPMATQGEDVEFEGHELTATILRNDAATPAWGDIAEFETEANAENYIKSALSIT